MQANERAEVEDAHRSGGVVRARGAKERLEVNLVETFPSRGRMAIDTDHLAGRADCVLLLPARGAQGRRRGLGSWRRVRPCRVQVHVLKSKQYSRGMLSDIQNLIELQKADREILRLREEVAALPKRVAAIETKLLGTQAVLEKAKTAIKADDGARRKAESAIQDLEQKISKYRDQSLEVKTNDQYKALMHEIQFAERDIRTNEDRILELMVNAEAREKDMKAAEAELKAETEEIEREKTEARKRTAEDELQLAEWSRIRDSARAAVNADLLRHYDRVAHHRGSGLSEVREQKCLACQVMLRPQTYNEVRGAEVVFCESCQRILYFDASRAKPEEPVVTHKRRRPHPKFESSQAWYYQPSFEECGEVLVAFINGGARSRRRVYDAATGRQIGEIREREGEYRLAFPEDLREAIRLNGNWEESELDQWGAELPMVVLDILHRDLDLARAEAVGRGHAQAPSVSPEHPAAS
ncbi:MAG TPA: C4-type zinc ribbon domain-containing protein [Terriglobales bacterium]|nr:C4-type zinc ribbon domain-containing protein [Terriglobales bacterium]